MLTEDERAEYEALVNDADFVSVLKTKARHYYWRLPKRAEMPLALAMEMDRRSAASLP